MNGSAFIGDVHGLRAHIFPQGAVARKERIGEGRGERKEAAQWY
jgi:hypothetical protein